MWEIFTYGAQPYTGVKNVDMVEYLSKGNRLTKPDLTPNEM